MMVLQGQKKSRFEIEQLEERIAPCVCETSGVHVVSNRGQGLVLDQAMNTSKPCDVGAGNNSPSTVSQFISKCYYE